jgi:hypothetical protein
MSSVLGQWGGALQEAWLPAVLAAALVLATLLVLRLLGRWIRRGRGPSEAARAADVLSVLAEVHRAQADLRQLGAELEGRLEEKLDRLEMLLAASRRVGADCGEPGASRLQPEPARELPAADPQTGGVSARDQERVLQLAALGKLPDAIAQSVGLLRGEVDLILRLHKISEKASRVQQS